MSNASSNLIDIRAEADGNRTRLPALAGTPVLKTGGPTRRPDASEAEDTTAARQEGKSRSSRSRPLPWNHVGSGVLRPGQDHHLQVQLARPVPADVPRRDGLAWPAPAWGLRSTRLPAGGGGREEDGAAEGRPPGADQGVGPPAGRGAGAGRDHRRDRPIRVPGGARSHGPAPRGTPSDLHRLPPTGAGCSAPCPPVRR